MDYLTKKLFGTSSEKTPSDIPGQLNLFNEAEAEQDPSLPEEDCIEEPSPRKKKATHAELFKGLTVHKQVIPLAEEDKICPVCGTPMKRIGEEYVRRELVFTPARCEIYEYYTESYGCPNCKEGNGDTEKAVITKSKAAPALIGRDPLLLLQLHGRSTRSMQTACPFTARKRTGRNTGQPSAVRPLPTGSSTVRSIISVHCTITSTVSFC